MLYYRNQWQITLLQILMTWLKETTMADGCPMVHVHQTLAHASFSINFDSCNNYYINQYKLVANYLAANIIVMAEGDDNGRWLLDGPQFPCQASQYFHGLVRAISEPVRKCVLISPIIVWEKGCFIGTKRGIFTDLRHCLRNKEYTRF